MTEGTLAGTAAKPGMHDLSAEGAVVRFSFDAGKVPSRLQLTLLDPRVQA